MPAKKPAARKPAGKKTTPKRTPVEAIKHKDKRPNIPTEELRDFIADEEKAPQTLLYPRDSSLDPQLVWKGKDEQDRQPLAVPAVPIYIQEKIHPQVIVEQVRAQARREQPESQIALFGDFDGLSFQDLIDFYRHEQSWTNRMILGDSLLVMTSLAEKEGLKGKVQMIYMDPPYEIKFGSNWQVSTRKRDIRDGSSEDATREPEQIKAFRDTWTLGIHSFLAYLRDRFTVSRELLTDSGSIFLQIPDEKVHLARCVLDEVFGSENAIALIRFRKKTMPLGARFLERMGDYLVWYAKDINAAESKYRKILRKQELEGDFHWDNLQLADGRRIRNASALGGSATPAEQSRRFRLVSLWPASYDPKAVYPLEYRGQEWWPPKGQCWPTSRDKMIRVMQSDLLEPEGNHLRIVLFEEGAKYAKYSTDWADTIGARDQTYVVETSPEVVQRCLLMTTDPGDLVLDPTCGSGTTAYVAEQWGRRWITIDTSRVPLALARQRLLTATFPYYELKEPPHGPSGGFVYKRKQNSKGEEIGGIVPHVTLKSIANNEPPNEEVLVDRPEVNNKFVRVSGPFVVEATIPTPVDWEGDGVEDSGAESVQSYGSFVERMIEVLRRAPA